MAPRTRAKKTAAPAVKAVPRSKTPESPVYPPVTPVKLKQVPRPVAVSIKQRGDNWVAEKTVEHVPSIEVRKRTPPARASKQPAKKAVDPLAPAPDKRVRKRSSTISSISDSIKQRINSWADRNKGSPGPETPDFLPSLNPYSSRHSPKATYHSADRFARTKAYRDDARELAALHELESLWEHDGIDVQKWTLHQRRRMGLELFKATVEATLIASRVRFYKALRDRRDQKIAVDMNILGPCASPVTPTYVPGAIKKKVTRPNVVKAADLSPLTLAAARATARFNAALEQRTKDRAAVLKARQNQRNTVKGEALMKALQATKFRKASTSVLEEQDVSDSEATSMSSLSSHERVRPANSKKTTVNGHAQAAEDPAASLTYSEMLIPIGILAFAPLVAKGLGLF